MTTPIDTRARAWHVSRRLETGAIIEGVATTEADANSYRAMGYTVRPMVPADTAACAGCRTAALATAARQAVEALAGIKPGDPVSSFRLANARAGLMTALLDVEA